jgi:SPP1 gp7 family putative phage head morphogenesis protein
MKIGDSYAFSDERAMLIARTETIRASNQGALASYRAADVAQKEWTTAEDDRVSEDCEANGDQGPIGIDEAFDSGDMTPPAHPNCRCVIVPVVTFASEQPTPEEQEA